MRLRFLTEALLFLMLLCESWRMSYLMWSMPMFLLWCPQFLLRLFFRFLLPVLQFLIPFFLQLWMPPPLPPLPPQLLQITSSSVQMEAHGCWRRPPPDPLP